MTTEADTNTEVDCGHCIRPEDRCSDESDRCCYRHPVTTQTVYVVDEDGATWVFLDQREAEAALVAEAWTGAVHLTITRAEVPAHLRDEALVDYCIGTVAPITCGAQ